MPTERIRITPDYVIAKNSLGTITYSAGTSPTTGTEFPSYLRSTETSETIDPSLGYDIYYNQLAPAIYPVNNVYPDQAVSSSMLTQGGTIFSCTQIPTITNNALSLTLTEPGVYVVVPTLWFRQFGTPQSYKDKTVLTWDTTTIPYRIKFQKLTQTNGTATLTDTYQNISLARVEFTDGSIGWFGPCNPVSAELMPIVLEYGITNSQSTDLINPASYQTTITIPATALNAETTQIISTYYKPALTIEPVTGSAISSSWPPGIIKILYYSRGYLKMRYTK